MATQPPDRASPGGAISLRYITFLTRAPLDQIKLPEHAIYMHHGQRWLGAWAIWESKRRFRDNRSFGGFMQAIRDEVDHRGAKRFDVHSDRLGQSWVTAIDRAQR